MKNSSLPESAAGFPIAADGLRVEYYVKVTGATGLFMDYRGVFDLPRAFGAVDLDLNLNDFSTFIGRFAHEGAARAFGHRLTEHVTQALEREAQKTSQSAAGMGQPSATAQPAAPQRPAPTHDTPPASAPSTPPWMFSEPARSNAAPQPAQPERRKPDPFEIRPLPVTPDEPALRKAA